MTNSIALLLTDIVPTTAWSVIETGGTALGAWNECSDQHSSQNGAPAKLRSSKAQFKLGPAVTPENDAHLPAKRNVPNNGIPAKTDLI